MATTLIEAVNIMINQTLIRWAHPGDAETIAGIHVDSWRAVYRKILPPSYLKNLDPGRLSGFILNGLLNPDCIYLIAEDEGDMAVGYICGGPERSHNPVYQSEIYELYVASGFQRQGFGRRLLSALADHLCRRQFHSMMVWVLAGNPNRRFYEKSGGLYLGRKTIAFAGRRLQAAAYGWIDISQAFMDRGS